MRILMNPVKTQTSQPPLLMEKPLPAQELMISLNFLFPDALEERGNLNRYTGTIAESLQRVVIEELLRLGVQHQWDSTHFLHLGTAIIPDSARCTECGTWVIPEENSHPACVVSSGWRTHEGRILCDQCWSAFDGEKVPMTM